MDRRRRARFLGAITDPSENGVMCTQPIVYNIIIVNLFIVG